jgi:hypothetical protein
VTRCSFVARRASRSSSASSRRVTESHSTDGGVPPARRAVAPQRHTGASGRLRDRLADAVQDRTLAGRPARHPRCNSTRTAAQSICRIAAGRTHGAPTLRLARWPSRACCAARARCRNVALVLPFVAKSREREIIDVLARHTGRPRSTTRLAACTSTPARTADVTAFNADMNCICGHTDRDHVAGGRCRVPDCPCEHFQPGDTLSAIYTQKQRDSPERNDR